MPPNPARTPGPCWSTACFGEAVDTSPMELSALGEHLRACHARCGRWFTLGCASDAARAFVAARFVTSLLVLVLLVGVGVGLWAW